MRGAVYIDAFNLYHAIDDQGPGWNYLKWSNLWRLSEAITKGHAKPLERVVWCSAFRKGDTSKKARHRAFVDAMDVIGVIAKQGHETSEPNECKSCGHKWVTAREKATDINLALSVYEDACLDRFDAAFIVTADTDQAATFAFVKERFPHKKLYAVNPPKREWSKHLISLADGKIQITERMLDDCVLPALVTNGVRSVTRPFEYDPPADWVHPDDRP